MRGGRGVGDQHKPRRFFFPLFFVGERLQIKTTTCLAGFFFFPPLFSGKGLRGRYVEDVEEEDGRTAYFPPPSFFPPLREPGKG